MPKPGALDQLHQVHELNRAFLGLLQSRVRQRRPSRLEVGEFDEQEHDLCFSILFAARQTSRESAYQARLLFGLEPGDVEQLRGAALAGLQRLACAPGILECAYRGQDWFWYGLITATRPELRRQLTLMALQPRLAVAWPQRRPPQPTA